MKRLNADVHDDHDTMVSTLLMLTHLEGIFF